MTQFGASSSISAALDAGGNVAADTTCIKCGYNVRGLPAAGRCPECGTPVSRSLGGTLLRFSDVAWLHKLKRGVDLILYGILLSVIVGIVGGIAATAAGSSAAPLLVNIITLGLGLMVAYGQWLLTEPDPSGRGEVQYGTMRKLVRASVIASIFSSVLNLLPVDRSSSAVSYVLVSIGVILALITIVGYIAFFFYLSRLAARVPDELSMNRSRFLGWAFPVSYGAMIILGLIAALGQSLAAGGLAIVVLIAVIVFAVMSLFLLGRMRRNFREQAERAEEIQRLSGAVAE